VQTHEPIAKAMNVIRARLAANLTTYSTAYQAVDKKLQSVTCLSIAQRFINKALGRFSEDGSEPRKLWPKETQKVLYSLSSEEMAPKPARSFSHRRVGGVMTLRTDDIHHPSILEETEIHRFRIW
jgi:hypothetical protein